MGAQVGVILLALILGINITGKKSDIDVNNISNQTITMELKESSQTETNNTEKVFQKELSKQDKKHQNELDKLTKELNNKNDELNKLETKIKKLYEQNTELKSNIENMEKEKTANEKKSVADIKFLNEQIKSNEKNIEKLTKNNEKLNKKIDELNKLVDNLKKNQSDANLALAKENTILNDKINVLTNDNSNINNENLKLKKDIEKLSASIDSEKKQSEEEMKSFKSGEPDSNKFAAENDSLKKQIADLTSKLESGNIKTDSAEKEALEKIRVELESKNAENSGLVEKLNDLNTQFFNLKNEQKQSIEKLAAENKEIKNELSKLETEKMILVKESETKKGALEITFLDKILFSNGQAILKESSKEALNKLVDILKKYENRRIQIEGHTDAIAFKSQKGKFKSNWDLSTARALATLEYIKTKGIKESRLNVLGYSDTKPAADNSTEEGRSKNRRVEILLYPEELIIKNLAE